VRSSSREKRRYRRHALGAALGSTFIGLLLMAQQTACSSVGDRYQCGDKKLICKESPDQKSCEARYACEWRDGCVHACSHEAHPPSTCVTLCTSNSGTSLYPRSEGECVGMSDCLWEPLCLEKPDLPCDISLAEDECRRRNCSWDLVGSAL